jgi:hypothetical protein
MYSCNPYFNMDNNIPEHYYDMSDTLCSGTYAVPIIFSSSESPVQACNAVNDVPSGTFKVQSLGTKQNVSTINGTAPTTVYDNCLTLTSATDPQNVTFRWSIVNDTLKVRISAYVAQYYATTGEAGYIGIALYPFGTSYPTYKSGHPAKVEGSVDNFTDLWTASASMFNGSRCYPFCIDDGHMFGYQPVLDTVAGGTDDLSEKKVTIDSLGYLYAEFTRPLASSDVGFDQDINITRRKSTISWLSFYMIV